MTKEEWKTKVEGGDVDAIAELINWVKKNIAEYNEFVLSVNENEPYYWLDFYFGKDVYIITKKLTELKVRLQGRITRTQIGYNTKRSKLNLGMEMKKFSLVENESSNHRSSTSSSSSSSIFSSSNRNNRHKHTHNERKRIRK